MKKNWNAVELLRHSRHDWLNKLQLIKGNLSLERVDRVNEIIEEIINETKNEAKLTNLKMIELASLLMTFNWKDFYFSIEYEVLGEERDLSMYDHELTLWCTKFFEIMNEAIKHFSENNLYISIQLLDEHARFNFDFSGTIEDKERILNFYTNHLQYANSFMTVLEYHVNDEEMMATIQLENK